MQSIPVVALGIYRHVAASMDLTFSNTPYRMAAILDLHGKPAEFTYNPHNLGAVLHTLQPRPQVFITGAAISGAMTRESIEVWDYYVKSLGVENTLLQGEPPADGDWRAEIMRKLDGKYLQSRKEL